MNDGILEVRNVTRTFDVSLGGFLKTTLLTAVADVSMNVQRGEVFAIVGESGSGKSTLAKMILGLTPASSGEILIDGMRVEPANRVALARRIQPVFQDPYSSLNPRKSVAQLIALPLVVHGIGNAAEQRAKVTDIMDRVGLPRRALSAYPAHLSGGQRQRVAIARALIMQPDVVLCDEPTSSLDVSVQAQILNLLLELKRDLGLTYIFISHNLAVVDHLADRVAVMYLGRFVEERDRAGIFGQPRHPYTRALLQSVLTPDPDLGVPAPQIGASPPGLLDRFIGCPFANRCPDVIAVCRNTPPMTHRLPDGSASCHLLKPEVKAQ